MTFTEFAPIYRAITSWSLSRGDIGDWTPWLVEEEEEIPPEEEVLPVSYHEYLSPLLTYFYEFTLGKDQYVFDPETLDPLVDDIKTFFGDIWSFVWADKSGGATWLSTISNWLWSGAQEIIIWLTAIRDVIYDQVLGLANFVSNIYTWVVWNLVDDVTTFVTNFFQPIVDAWNAVTATLELWLSRVYDGVYAFVNGPIDWIKDVFKETYDWLGSIKDAVWDSIVEAYTTIADWLSIIKSVIKDCLIDTAVSGAPWLRGIKDTIWDSIVEAYTTIADWLSGIKDAILTALVDTDDTGVSWLSGIRDNIWDALITAIPMVGPGIYTSMVDATPGFVSQLQDALLWLWDNVKTAFIFVIEDFLPAVWESASGALGWLKDEFTNIISLAYDELLEKATSLVPITPERSATVAAGMFGSAVGFGALAHGMALAVEAVPNLKYMGVHYLSAFVTRMGSFGTISSATMGVIAALAIREPFSYYMKSVIRPTQPRELDLQIMAVKPDIDIETFRQGMKYQGYTDFWIDAIERTMYHEPSYFELSMLGEDEAATVDWLFTKARRSGYTEEDATVFVSSMIKKVTRDQRKEYYKQAFNAFKEGYISDTQFKEHLDHLDIRPEAKVLATKAANMAYQADLNKELISIYRRSFAEDMITEWDFKANLASLGLTTERVDAILELEWVKKEPKILKAERKETEVEWRKIQAEYTKVYIEGFRRGLITEYQLATNLIAIGMIDRVAKARARHEAIKLVPKPKPLEISIPLLPVPPAAPVYDV